VTPDAAGDAPAAPVHFRAIEQTPAAPFIAR